MTLHNESSLRLAEHLKSCATTVCRCWKIERSDGQILGFTDHDVDIEFGGTSYLASSGLTARTLVQTTGLSVDNSEVVGALSSLALDRDDILAGRYDNATIRIWLVNWADPAARMLEFAGSLGEIVQRGNSFEAELRSLSECLNQPRGAVFQSQCSAVFGDAACGLPLGMEPFSTTAEIFEVEAGRTFRFDSLGTFAKGWFARGRLTVSNGAASGLVGIVKADRMASNLREIELWQGLRVAVAPGDSVVLDAGCDKRASTCRQRFDNIVNFRGFPHIPGEDWLTTYPRTSGENDGGSLFGGSGGFNE